MLEDRIEVIREKQRDQMLKASLNKDPSEEWTIVESRSKQKRANLKSKATVDHNGIEDRRNNKDKGQLKNIKSKGKPVGRVKLPRPPRHAAVALMVAPGAIKTYAEAMAMAKDKINLAEIGITELRPRRAITGALILQVPGAEGSAKADNLADKLTTVLDGTGIRVSRPKKKIDIRIRGLDDSVTPKEVAAAVATTGGCSIVDVKVGNINFTSGMCTAWVQCPSVVGIKLIKAGRIMIGWSAGKVEVLDPRPLQCFKYWEMGHVRTNCPNDTDRSNRCYACGDNTHKAKDCKAQAKCLICSEQGRPSDHRVGSKKCTPPKPKVKRGSEVPDAVSSATVPVPSPMDTSLTTTEEVRLSTTNTDSPDIGNVQDIAALEEAIEMQ